MKDLTVLAIILMLLIICFSLYEVKHELVVMNENLRNLDNLAVRVYVFNERTQA